MNPKKPVRYKRKPELPKEQRLQRIKALERHFANVRRSITQQRMSFFELTKKYDEKAEEFRRRIVSGEKPSLNIINEINALARLRNKTEYGLKRMESEELEILSELKRLY